VPLARRLLLWPRRVPEGCLVQLSPPLRVLAIAPLPPGSHPVSCAAPRRGRRSSLPPPLCSS